jgi:putative nucleotidyltransferase with HDIG domain
MIDAAKVQERFADLLEMIGEERLRGQVVEAWLLACAEGGWTDLEQVERMPFSLLTDCGGLGFLEHTEAVTRGALGLAQAQVDAYEKMPYRIDFDRLVAGGLLHDVGKLLEIEPDGAGGYRMSRHGRSTRHPISGTVIAARAGLPVEVQNIIACHSREGEGQPRTVETILIHQADFATFDPFTMRAAGKLIED